MFRLILFLAGLAAALPPLRGDAEASCNLIPAAERTFPSTLGAISGPITSPGKTVEIRLRPRCDASPGFDAGNPSNNIVTLTFEPLGGTPTDVAIGGVVVDDALTLRFVVPDTDSLLSPPGDGLALAGPARIRVRNPSSTLLAEIGSLFEPTATCDRFPEQVFRQLTVLPSPNVFADLASGASNRILATLDGGRNLLIPLEYLSILPNGPGAPIARLVEGETSIEAFSGGGSPIQVPSSDYVRSFTLDGRPLPPLLRVNAAGDLLFGTADAVESVIRIARTDGASPDIYDLTDRLFSGQGPIVIDRTADGFSASTRERVPLRGLRSSGQTVAFVRDESLEGDLNGDGDDNDRLVQIIDVQSGSGSPTNLPIVEVSRDGFSGLALETAGTLSAFLESEAAGGHSDLNGDGDAFDSILRVFTNAGTGLAPLPIVADPAPVVNGRSLIVSGSLVFFRAREGDDFPRVSERVSVGAGSLQANRASDSPAISADGRFVAFASLAYNLIPGTNGASLCAGGTPNGVPEGSEQCDDANLANGDGCDAGCHLEPARSHILLYDRDLDSIQRVSVNNAGELGNDDSFEPSISADGRYVAFTSFATNLVAGDTNGFGDAFVFDRSAGTVARASVSSAGVTGNGDSLNPAISGDGRYVAFASGATSLVAGDTNARFDVFVRDRALNTTERVSLSTSSQQADQDAFDPAISGDGRYVAFVSDATNLVVGDGNLTSDVFVRDRGLLATERVSISSTGTEGDDFSFDVSVSADGRQVAFNSLATNLVPNDSNAREDVFVFDRQSRIIERVSVADDGTEGDDSSILPAIGRDGRFVAFQSFATNLVTDDTNSAADVFVYDRDTNTIERASVDDNGLEANGLSSSPALGTNGRHTVFVSAATNLIGIGSDTNGVQDVFMRGIGSGTSSNADGDIADTVLQVFDSASGMLRPSARTAATEVAVSSGRAVVVTAEADEGGADLNGDGDAGDGVAQLYDGSTDSLLNLQRAARQGAISASLVAVIVSEAEQGGLDLNGDGDAFDEVLGVQIIGAPVAVENVGVAADAVAAIGDTIAFSTPEDAEDTTDLNGDRDTDDRVLRIYDVDTGLVTEVGVAAADFIVGETLIALRTPEADQGVDLNGDGDLLDLVMQAYDLTTGTLVSSGQAAILCTLPGCEPFTPYKIRGDTVSFLCREADQGNTDLNGDGDALDVVMHVFNPRNGIIQVFDQSADSPELNPLPDEIIEAPILYVQASEVAAGRDLNGDGDQTDLAVVLLAADTDEDQTFDDLDSCVESANPQQDDSDLDGLGDTCDPTVFCGDFVPPLPGVPPAGALACQDAAQKAAASYLKTRASAIRSCLSRIASGKLMGSASGSCRGNFATGVEVLPEDASTAKKLARAAAKLEAAVAKSCSPAAASALGACGSTPTELASCILAAYGSSAIAASRLAYGEVQTISDRTVAACQSTLGKESASYLSAVVKAQHGCLNRFVEGDLAGDPQVGCLGGLGVGGVVLPTDTITRAKIALADAKLRAAIAGACPGATLASLDACGTTPSGAGDCLLCTHWRRAVESVRSIYGPQ